MENAEEILQCLDEFSKLRPKVIPPELEYYLSFVARTGDPVYQWPLIKCLFREKLINVITEFYEACPSIEIPPCPNVEIFNYEAMKGFILEKLDTFAAAPFTVQRICELLTSPRMEYNRIDKYMRALEKNILVVSTREPGNRKSTENGESVVNGLESEHGSTEMVNSLNSDINVEVDMDEKTVWHKSYAVNESNIILESHPSESIQIQESYVSESKTSSATPAPTLITPTTPTTPATPAAPTTPTTTTESVITTRQINYIGYTNEMIVEPSTTINSSNSNSNISEDVAPPPQLQLQLQLPESSGVPTVFTLHKEDEQMYVSEEGGPAFTKPDCSEMDTDRIISETETEPITPPEPDDKAEQPESSSIVESTSQTIKTTTVTIVAAATAAVIKEEEEATISSSDEMPQSSTEQPQSQPQPQPELEAKLEDREITASDHQEVTESNIVIGPEDMQVEDISPEPETEAEAEAEAETETEVETEAKVKQTPVHPETPEKILENPETTEEIKVETVCVVENITKTEEILPAQTQTQTQEQAQTQDQKEEVETIEEEVKVTENN